LEDILTLFKLATN